MHCREFTDFLDDYLSGDLSADERSVFETHLVECPSCVAYLESYRRTIHLAKTASCASENPPLPLEIPEELIQAILRTRRRRS
jgi:anti-sigma factor RsiW